MLRWLGEGAVAWQGTTLGSDLPVPLHEACCRMKLGFSAVWQLLAGRSAVTGVGTGDWGDDLLLSQSTISHFHQREGLELFVALC